MRKQMQRNGSMTSHFSRRNSVLPAPLKLIFCLAVYFLSLLGLCEDPAAKLDGFAGILFGSSKDQVKTAMDARGAHLNADKSSSAHMEFQGGAFGKDDVLYWHLYFVNGKFFRGSASINSPFSERFAKYEGLKKLIIEKYGAPAEETTNTGTSEQNDDDNDQNDLYDAVRSGKALVKAQWTTDSGSITCEILKRYNAVWIRLTYEDKALAKVYSDKQLKDY